MDNKALVAQAIAVAVPELDLATITAKLETPKSADLGDAAFPTFTLAKVLRKAPQQIATDILAKIDQSAFEKVVAVGPYLNFFFDKNATTNTVLRDVLAQGAAYGQNNDGAGANITIDMSSPNIAKPMSFGHLRSTVIGNAFANLVKKNGYNPIKINHLGDWGTQFGLMIAAYKKWGNKPIEEYSVDELVKLYVEINKAAKTDEAVADAGRNWFKKLEDGDAEAVSLWQTIRDASLSEFQEVYERLHITFDSMNGEAFFNDKMIPVVAEIKDKNLLTNSQGAEIVDLPTLLPDENLPISMILKSNDSTAYITRDLAAAEFRQREYDFVKSLYVVGAEQTEHFRQLKAILKLMGHDWSDDIEHISYGLITINGEKMSTRKGNVVTLVEVLNMAHEAALKQISEKNPDLPNKDLVAEQVGAGAVVFNDLMNERKNFIDFTPADAVKFEGDTGPYVQYTIARANSILRKAGVEVNVNDLQLDDAATWDTITLLKNFPTVVRDAWSKRDTSMTAKFALRLARAFNKYYANSKILVDDEQRNSRLALVSAVIIVLTEALNMLGVEAPSEM
ncbi:arginine--tRNA ligase [Weissella soli]|uniref:arginine--tRNA ligase n=1 Tax=Weissella soli TaxID=155866 RepID=UPI0011BB465E|nr:arginine--tRNA ligase [Weissella soli]QEA34907.1 arginine--tRNA ligase [Weissella soli]